MARFLFVIVPVVARVWPAVAIADELVARGHEVAWCGPESDLRPRIGAEMTIYPTGKRSYREFRELGMAAVRELWDEYLIPLNRFIRGPVERAVEDFRPDVIFADQYALAGALAARKFGVKWATLCAGALEITPPQDPPGLQEWVHAKLAQVGATAGLSEKDSKALLFSPSLVVATTSAALTGPVPLPENTHLIGAALGARRTDTGFDWSWWDPGRKHILVTAGTLSAHLVQDYLARMLAALAPLGEKLQVVLNAAEVPDAPAHVLVAPRVPMLELMPRLDAVVCQAGQSTVNEALWHGVPLVVAPIRLGELVVADQVTRSGSGIRVSYAESTSDELGAAVSAVLEEPSYLERARTVSAEFRAGGGTMAAADRLVNLADNR